jgi:hypothetical protein
MFGGAKNGGEQNPLMIAHQAHVMYKLFASNVAQLNILKAHL